MPIPPHPLRVPRLFLNQFLLLMNNLITRIKTWFANHPLRIAGVAGGVIALVLILAFGSQLGTLLNLFASHAGTGHSIIVNGNPAGDEHGFLETGYVSQPDNCFKIDATTHRLMLNNACPQPQVITIDPTEGGAGDPVSIDGTGFGTVSGKVEFGSALATIVTWTDTRIEVAAPSQNALGTFPVKVTIPGNVVSIYNPGYSYLANPVVTSISPNIGPSGTVVTIVGTGFIPNGQTPGSTVLFGTTHAIVTSVTATQITATAPAGASGTVDVIVANPSGQVSEAVPTDRYTYTP